MTDVLSSGGASAPSSGQPGSPHQPPDGDPPPRPLPPQTVAERWTDLRDRINVSPGRLIVAVVILLLVAGLAWWALRPPPPPVEQSLPMAAPTTLPAAVPGAVASGASLPTDAGAPGTAAGPIVVHAAGAVTRPGVYQLAPGARVSDLLAAAGGTPPDADLDRLNLAAPVADGSRVWVPKQGELAEPPPVAVASPPASAPPSGSTGSGTAEGPAALVDLNTATAEQLDTLPGVGPATAQAILDYRQEHGRFGSVDELLEVRGIGDAKLADLRDKVRV